MLWVKTSRKRICLSEEWKIGLIILTGPFLKLLEDIKDKTKCMLAGMKRLQVRVWSTGWFKKTVTREVRQIYTGKTKIKKGLVSFSFCNKKGRIFSVSSWSELCTAQHSAQFSAMLCKRIWFPQVTLQECSAAKRPKCKYKQTCVMSRRMILHCT